jgi:hypothetical protein
MKKVFLAFSLWILWLIGDYTIFNYLIHSLNNVVQIQILVSLGITILLWVNVGIIKEMLSISNKKLGEKS